MAWQLAMAVCAAMSAVGQKGVSLFVVIGDSVLFCLVVLGLLLLLLFAGPLILVVLCANEGLLIFYSSSIINKTTHHDLGHQKRSRLYERTPISVVQIVVLSSSTKILWLWLLLLSY